MSQPYFQHNGMLYVSPSGDDDPDNHPNNLYPFKTLSAAKAAAQSGDTIIVLPGTYRDANLLKNGVSWHFLPGAKVYRTRADSTAAPSIFDDGPNGTNSAVTCVITGQGEFYVDDTLINEQGVSLGDEEDSFNPGLIFSTYNESTNIFFQCKGMYSPSTDCPNACFLIHIRDCAKVSMYVDEVLTLSPGQVGAVLWIAGELYTTFGKVQCFQTEGNGGTYPFWASEPAAGAADNWYCRVDFVESHYSVVYFDGATANYKMWFECFEMRSLNDSTDGGGVNLSAIECLNNGKLYVRVQKVQTTGAPTKRLGPIVYQNGGELWFEGMKCTALSVANQTGNIPLFVQHEGGTAHYTVQQWEHSGVFSGDGIRITAGTVNINGGVMNVLNGKGLVNTGGILRVNGLRIDTTNTNAAGNNPVSLGAANVILNGCILLAPALADAITGAFTIKIYGNVLANKAKNAGTTVAAGMGSLVVDAAVT